MDYRFILRRRVENVKPEIKEIYKSVGKRRFNQYIKELKSELFIGEMEDYGYHFKDSFKYKLQYEIDAAVDKAVTEIIIL